MVAKLLTVALCFISTQALAAPTPLPIASPGSPAPSKPVHYCASLKTGIPSPMKGMHCGSGAIYLGSGPVSAGKSRPAELNLLLRNRLRSAQIAGKKHGYSIGITSGWRSLSEQQRIYRNAVKVYKNSANKWAMPPAKSMHPWGLAIDVHFNTQAAANWFKQNSATFGLCRMYKNEWWHFEPVIAPGGRCPKLRANAG